MSIAAFTMVGDSLIPWHPVTLFALEKKIIVVRTSKYIFENWKPLRNCHSGKGIYNFNLINSIWNEIMEHDKTKDTI